MEHTSWKKVDFLYPDEVPTMISHEEKQYLYWLGQSFWTGQGAVVEVGPWLGGSTICLAAGMKASSYDAKGKLHTYDNFIWRDFMAERASLPIQAGNSFLPYFKKNIKGYDEIIVAHSRSLPDEEIRGDFEASNKRFVESEEVPIFDGILNEFVEILFIDGAKSWLGMRHLLAKLNSRFVPGKTCFVCQDFKYWGTYWVPIMISRLNKYLKPVHNALNGTTVTFQLISKIPSELVESLGRHVIKLPTQQCLQEIEYASELLEKDGDQLGSKNLMLSKVSFLSHQGKVAQAVEEFHKIQSSWPPFLSTNQLERARAYLHNEKVANVPVPLKLKLFFYVNKIVKKLRKIENLAKI